VSADRSIAWLVTFLCMFYAGRAANAFVAHNSTLYTALALFTLGRALLLPYYGNGDQSELFVAYGGFLAIYIGFLLVLESGTDGADKNWARSVLQRVGLVLLVVVAAPSSALSLPGPDGQPMLGVSVAQTEKIVTLILSMTGFTSIAYGVYCLCGKRVGLLVGLVVAGYAILEVIYAIVSWHGAPMSGRFYLAFSVAKLVYTATFVSALVYHGMTDSVRNAGYAYWLLRMCGVAPTLSSEHRKSAEHGLPNIPANE
jgi:hypothetical protein